MICGDVPENQRTQLIGFCKTVTFTFVTFAAAYF